MQLEIRFTKLFKVTRLGELMVNTGCSSIKVAGTILECIGVSGIPFGLSNEKRAQAGIDAIRDDLEMEGN